MWGPRQKEEDKVVPGWGSKQAKVLHKERDVKVEREGRRCMWDWEETEVDMYDLIELLIHSSFLLIGQKICQSAHFLLGSVRFRQ